MKISFDDGSLIYLDETTNTSGKVITITMCGLNKDGNRLTMSSSELDIMQVKELNEFLHEVIKKFA